MFSEGYHMCDSALTCWTLSLYLAVGIKLLRLVQIFQSFGEPPLLHDVIFNICYFREQSLYETTFSTKISDTLPLSFFLLLLITDLTFLIRFGNFPSSNWKPITTATLVISTQSPSLLMARLLLQEAKTASLCFGTWTRANTCTLWRPVTLSMPLFFHQTDIGCAPPPLAV